MDKNVSRDWRRVLGSGCLVNLIATSLLVIVFTIISTFTIDTIAWPFLIGATLSFGGLLFNLRRSGDGGQPIRNLILVGIGVLLGSIATVFGIAAYILISGSIN